MIEHHLSRNFQVKVFFFSLIKGCVMLNGLDVLPCEEIAVVI